MFDFGIKCEENFDDFGIKHGATLGFIMEHWKAKDIVMTMMGDSYDFPKVCTGAMTVPSTTKRFDHETWGFF